MSRGIVILRAVALLVLIGATGYSLYLWSYLPLRCVHAASLGAAALNAAEQRNEYLMHRLAGRVRSDLDGCDCVFRADVRIPFALGDAAVAAGDARSAVREYQQALLLDRRPEIYLNLGLAQLEALDRPAAVDNLARACAFNPALLSEIPYEEIRQETRQRLRVTYGEDWIEK